MSSEASPELQSPPLSADPFTSSDVGCEPYHGLDDHETFVREGPTLDGHFHSVQLAYLQSHRVEYLFATAEQRKYRELNLNFRGN